MNVLEGFHRLPINNLVGILCGMNVVRVFLGWRWIPMLWQPTDVVINSNFTNNFGENILALRNNSLYLIGDGFTSKGQFPFLDKLDLSTMAKNRLYKSNIKVNL